MEINQKVEHFYDKFYDLLENLKSSVIKLPGMDAK